MALSDSARLVRHAFDGGYAVAQINTNGATYGLTRAICEVAAKLKSPVILGAYEANLGYRGFEFAAHQMRWFAQHTDAPVAVHLDHGMSVEGCGKAIKTGFTSVMIDGSALPIDENIKQTSQVVERAKPAGVSVEAEVGELQKLNPDGTMAELKNLSEPEHVQRMSTETGIDMLAVGIGNAHGFYKGQPDIHFDMLEQYARVTSVPLVLHGTTGLSDQTMRRCVSMGMAKINLGTLVRTRYVEHTQAVIAQGQHKHHPWRVEQAVVERIKPDIEHTMEVIRSVGKAESPAHA